jgi:5-methylcytosine-specific restriction endonuclease McrBC regulatory subunit McrC
VSKAVPSATFEPRRLSIPERGALQISEEVFARLRQQPSFNRLLVGGILSASISGNKLELSASHYLGTAHLENSWTIEVREKAPGTLRGLFAELSNARYKLADADAESYFDGELFGHVVTAFLKATEEYVSRGRFRRYENVDQTTRRPRGKINFQETIKHHCRGDLSTAHVTSSQLTADTPQNQIIGYCLAQIEVLSLQYPSLKPLLPKARTLYLMFGDTDHHALNRLPDYLRVARLSALMSDSRARPSLRNVLELAFPLFVGGGLHGSELANFKLPALFVDMEFLFEQSVLRLFDQTTGLKATSGKTEKVKLFPKGVSRYRCDPDIVVSSSALRTFAVGDVKYKTLATKGPANDDVYQLLAHAEAFSVKEAFLVYPGDRFTSFKLGQARSDISVTVFSVRPQLLRQDIGGIASALLSRAAT